MYCVIPPLPRLLALEFVCKRRQLPPQLGADACLRKPLKVDRLLEVVALLTIGAKPSRTTR